MRCHSKRSVQSQSAHVDTCQTIHKYTTSKSIFLLLHPHSSSSSSCFSLLLPPPTPHSLPSHFPSSTSSSFSLFLFLPIRSPSPPPHSSSFSYSSFSLLRLLIHPTHHPTTSTPFYIQHAVRLLCKCSVSLT